jgi:hypothetical protein
LEKNESYSIKYPQANIFIVKYFKATQNQPLDMSVPSGTLKTENQNQQPKFIYKSTFNTNFINTKIKNSFVSANIILIS